MKRLLLLPLAFLVVLVGALLSILMVLLAASIRLTLWWKERR